MGWGGFQIRVKYKSAAQPCEHYPEEANTTGAEMEPRIRSIILPAAAAAAAASSRWADVAGFRLRESARCASGRRAKNK